MKRHVILTIGIVALVLAAPALAQITPSKESLSNLCPGKAYPPYAQRSFPSQALWGDTHLHTGLSVDAGLFGARLGLEEAYRFGRGNNFLDRTTGQTVAAPRLAGDRRPFLGIP